MSKFIDHAVELRKDTVTHYNCAQSVFLPFAAAKGMDLNTAYAVAANFGSGMKRASVCGAVTGALMALGIYGVEDESIGAFHRAIKENHKGCLDCSDLLRIAKEEGQEKKPHCDALVYECVEQVERILTEKGLV